jgi:hypothetical protein
MSSFTIHTSGESRPLDDFWRDPWRSNEAEHSCRPRLDPTGSRWTSSIASVGMMQQFPVALRVTRGRPRGYSDVILRLVELEAWGGG